MLHWPLNIMNLIMHPYTGESTNLCVYSLLHPPQNETEYCLLLALPCGRDANDVRTQTHALKNSLITYLLQKQAAGIINVPGPQARHW